MINQITTWWVNNFSLQPNNNNDLENIILSIISMGSIVVYWAVLAKYLGFGDPKYALINALINIVTMAFSLRIISQIYSKIVNHIIQTLDPISTKLLNHYDLQPNPEMNNSPLPEYISQSEHSFSCFVALIGGATGFFLIGTALYHSLRFIGLPETIGSGICYAPAMLLGAIPGCMSGFTAGRLIYHAPEIISKILEKRRSYQQARAIITLNNLHANVDQNRDLSPEILGIMHSYIIGTSEQESTRIIHEVIDESNHNICNMVNNKISFFASRGNQSRQLIENIEDEFDSTSLLQMYRGVKNF
jgi:hypothetical protein